MKPARRPAIFKCRHSDPELMAAVSVRMLLAHQADGFAERGVALSLSYDPTPSTPGGLLIVDNMLWGGRIFDAADRSPSIVDQLADADPRWDDRGALAAGVVTGPRPAAIAPKGVFGDGDLQDASARVWGRARPRRPTRGRPAVQSLPHRAARRIGRRSTRVRGPHRRPWPSPPSRSRRSGAPGGRETRRPRHGPVAGHVSGTSPLMPAFHAVGCATPGGRPYAVVRRTRRRGGAGRGLAGCARPRGVACACCAR